MHVETSVYKVFRVIICSVFPDWNFSSASVTYLSRQLYISHYIGYRDKV